MKTFLAFSLSEVELIMLINVKIPTIVDILTFMSMTNFMLTSGHGLLCYKTHSMLYSNEYEISTANKV